MKEDVVEVFVIGCALFIISLVHGAQFGLRGPGGNIGDVWIRTKGHFSNHRGETIILGAS